MAESAAIIICMIISLAALIMARGAVIELHELWERVTGLSRIVSDMSKLITEINSDRAELVKLCKEIMEEVERCR